MRSETNQQRSVEEIGHERDTTREALDNLLREQQELEEQRRTLLDDESLTEAAMSGKPLGARSSMRKVLDRLAGLPSLQYVLQKKLLSLQIEFGERQLEEKEAERREALALVEEALAAKWEAEEKFDQEPATSPTASTTSAMICAERSMDCANSSLPWSGTSRRLGAVIVGSEPKSFSEQFNRALREVRGDTVEAGEKNEGNRQMTDLIRRAVDKGQHRIDQRLEDRGEE